MALNPALRALVLQSANKCRAESLEAKLDYYRDMDSPFDTGMNIHQCNVMLEAMDVLLFGRSKLSEAETTTIKGMLQVAKAHLSEAQEGYGDVYNAVTDLCEHSDNCPETDSAEAS